MVDRLTFAGLFVLLQLAAAAAADSLDPTRPPDGFAEQADSPSPAAAPTAPLVVSSLFLMGAKPYAVVDGQIVRPGDPLADGKVGKIDANGVWIVVTGADQRRGGMRLLKWLPEVVKTPVKPGDVRKTPAAARTEKK